MDPYENEEDKLLEIFGGESLPEEGEAKPQGKLEDYALPDSVTLPLDPIFKVPKRALIYALPSGFRVVGRVRHTTYNKNNKIRLPRWRLIPRSFDSYSEARRFVDMYIWEHFDKYKHKGCPATEVTRGDSSVSERVLSELWRYGEIHHSAHYREWRISRRYCYPGDYDSDNVYWLNRGLIKAAACNSGSVPSWCLKGMA